jgi:hypothetical protein
MRCTRYGGLMVYEEFEDFALESGGDGFWGQRCINCGAIVDLVIAAPSTLTSRTVASHSALTTMQGRFVMHALCMESWWRRDSAWRLPLR